MIGFASFDRRISGGMYDGENVGRFEQLRIKADKAGFGGQIHYGGRDGGIFQQFLFQGVDAGSAVQSAHREAQLSGRINVV